MSKGKRRIFTAEQKPDAVHIVKTSQESLLRIAGNPDIGETVLEKLDQTGKN